MIRIAALLTVFCAAAAAQSGVGLRLVMGLTDKENTKWDGSASAQGANITKIEPWRFDGDDQMQPGNAWKVSIHKVRQFGAQRPQGAAGIVPNGVIVWLDSATDTASVQVHTQQGDFRVSLADVPFGKHQFALNNRVMIDRVPPFVQITSDPDEQDMPAAAIAKDAIWVAYLDFKHHPDSVKLRVDLKEAPKDFKRYTEKTGGDQIMARRYSNGKWSEAIAISPPHGDVYRPAIAADGSGRAWVFWSANRNGNFDMFARSIQGEKPGKTIQLSTEAGSDIDPVAATDSKGQVWVAWQGWRSGRASIFSAAQQGDSFAKVDTVSSSSANEWNASIAADKTGRVSVAYESYRNGNYDIYLKTATGPGAWGSEVPVATSARYEAYPSIAYDPAGRLWVAYEEAPEGWGKDFGAYETTGIALYQGRAIRIRGLKDGNWITTSPDVGGALSGVASYKVENAAKQSDSEDWLKLNLKYAENRGPSRAATGTPAPKNTSPRLAIDPSGRLWLAYRSPQPIWWNPIGTTWSEYVVSWDGSTWTDPIFLAHSDGLLNNRPALLAAKRGELLVVNSSDHRRDLTILKGGTGQYIYYDGAWDNDPYNNDLFISSIALSPGSGSMQTQAAPAPSAVTDPWVEKERKALATMRGARTPEGLRVLRGEFHRHSEISMDGGGDGTVLEQWRYAIDAGALDWIGCCDHDNGAGREYTWWMTQKQTDIFHNPGTFIPMFSYERSVSYPEGHRNVIFEQRGVRTLPRLPKTDRDAPGSAPDTQMLYRYLKQFHGIVASHTSGTSMGTDWRDNDALAEPVVEIYQGERQNYEMPGAPRTNKAEDSIGGWEPKGFINLALAKGYKLSFEASSDHISTHMSFANVLAKDSSRKAVLAAFEARHVYAATENILADFRTGNHIMGDAFSAATAPEFKVKLTGTGNFKKVLIVKDGKYVYTSEPGKPVVEFTWRDNSPPKGTSYYYVRGEQEDGNVVWVSPMWVTYP